MSAKSSLRILLVDDHPILRVGLANVLNSEPGFSVVAEASDGPTAIELWQKHQPDVMVLDINMSGMDGIETLERLRESFPQARVLMLTSSEATEDLRHALQLGALGYITKDSQREELVAAIRSVSAGQKVVSDAMARELAISEEAEISKREREVLGLVRQGFTNADIGRLLGISERTAKFHVAALLTKLHAADRAEAVARGFERGLLK